MGTPAKFVILDLDGLLLDTESTCVAVAQQVVERHGATLTLEAQRAALGKRPLDCWTDLAAVLGLGVPPQQLLDESEALLTDTWCHAKLLPGAWRLLWHLHCHNVPFAIATSTPRATFDKKMSDKQHLRDILRFVVCGDEVPKGKPHPDVFLEAARLMGAQPCDCLVLEDAPSGVEGASTAGMRVVAVPSLVGCNDLYPKPDPTAEVGVCSVLGSLLSLQLKDYGLPEFDDVVEGIIPLAGADSIHIRGTVVKGFGRGSRELGIPTANVDGAALRATLAEAVTGIYAGFASIGKSPEVYKMVMSIGWNPFFGNKEKTAEPWILHEFAEPFYGEEIRLVVCGYVRPEANFTSLQALIDRIKLDGEMSQKFLDHPTVAALRQDPLLQPGAFSRSGTAGSGRLSTAGSLLVS